MFLIFTYIVTVEFIVFVIAARHYRVKVYDRIRAVQRPRIHTYATACLQDPFTLTKILVSSYLHYRVCYGAYSSSIQFIILSHLAPTDLTYSIRVCVLRIDTNLTKTKSVFIAHRV